MLRKQQEKTLITPIFCTKYVTFNNNKNRYSINNPSTSMDSKNNNDKNNSIHIVASRHVTKSRQLLKNSQTSSLNLIQKQGAEKQRSGGTNTNIHMIINGQNIKQLSSLEFSKELVTKKLEGKDNQKGRQSRQVKSSRQVTKEQKLQPQLNTTGIKNQSRMSINIMQKPSQHSKPSSRQKHRQIYKHRFKQQPSDFKQYKKQYTQQLINNKNIQLQKLKLQISMHLKKNNQSTTTMNAANVNSNDETNNHHNPNKVQNQTHNSHSLDSTHKLSYSINGVDGSYYSKNYSDPNMQNHYADRQRRLLKSDNKYSNISNLQNLYKKRKQQRQYRIVGLRNRSHDKQKEREVQEAEIRQMHRKSFTIKQIRPQKKQRLDKNEPICSPTFGKTYGSYYQIVAIQKKFENSRYFNGQNTNCIVGDQGKYYGLGGRYHSRIVDSNNQYVKWKSYNGGKISNNKISFGKYEGQYIEPWKLHEDNYHDGF